MRRFPLIPVEEDGPPERPYPSREFHRADVYVETLAGVDVQGYQAG